MPKSGDSQEKEIAALERMIQEAEDALQKMRETVEALELKTKDSKEKKRGT